MNSVFSFLTTLFCFLSLSAQTSVFKLKPEGFDTIRIKLMNSENIYYKFNHINSWVSSNPILKSEGVRVVKTTIKDEKEMLWEISLTKRNLKWFLRDGTPEDIGMEVLFKTIIKNDSLTLIYHINDIFNKRFRQLGPEIFFDDKTTVSHHNIEIVKSIETEANNLANSFINYVRSDLKGKALSNMLVDEGQLLIDENKYKKALPYFKQAIKADSSNYFAYLAEACTYYFMDDKNIALQKLIEATLSKNISGGLKLDLYRFIAAIYQEDYNDKPKAYDALMESRALNFQIIEEIENLENQTFYLSSLHLWEKSYLDRAYSFSTLGYEEEAKEELDFFENLAKNHIDKEKLYQALVDHYLLMDDKVEATRILEILILEFPQWKSKYQNQKSEFSN